MTFLRRTAYGFLGAVLLLSAGSLAMTAIERRQVRSLAPVLRQNAVLARPVSYSPGRKILFAYIGSEDCSFSLLPGFDTTVKSLEALIEKQAQGEGSSFSTLGVSVGPSVSRGIEYLQRFGSFDEIAVGHGQLNTVAMRYIWEEFPGEPSFPQVIVIERQLKTLEPGYTFEEERILVRAVGVPQIRNWVASNAPIR